MAKDRVYRPKLSNEKIIEQLQTGKGKQFTPDVADEMIRFIEEGLLDKYVDLKHGETLYLDTQGALSV